MLLVHRALQRLDGILVSVSSVSVSPERGDSLRLSLGCFLVFTSSFSANVFFCWALQDCH